MDRLYKELFPIREKPKKLKRSEIITEAFKDYEYQLGKINDIGID